MRYDIAPCATLSCLESPNRSFLRVDLEQHCKNSDVHRVFLEHQVVIDIAKWVNQSLDIRPVPEVGGFLIGQFQQKELGYDLAIVGFCPAREVTLSNPFLLNFGSRPLQILDRELANYQNCRPVGWFHTHPGHSPFLSKLDLRIHNGFFREPFEIAVVLDPFTPNHDTGFFARCSDGKMSNKEQINYWISWHDLINRLNSSSYE